MTSLHFEILDDRYTLYRFSPDVPIPSSLFQSPFFSVTRTDKELSILYPETLKHSSQRSETGWAGLKIRGPLDFSLVGILSEVSKILARAEIPIFVQSTYDTDYIFVPFEHLRAARRALESAGGIFDKN